MVPGATTTDYGPSTDEGPSTKHHGLRGSRRQVCRHFPYADVVDLPCPKDWNLRDRHDRARDEDLRQPGLSCRGRQRRASGVGLFGDADELLAATRDEDYRHTGTSRRGRKRGAAGVGLFVDEYELLAAFGVGDGDDRVHR